MKIKTNIRSFPVKELSNFVKNHTATMTAKNQQSYHSVQHVLLRHSIGSLKLTIKGQG